MACPVEALKTTQLDHLGLVAGMFDELKIGETLDKVIKQDTQKRHVSIGQAVKAMVLNGLGFVNKTLYLSPSFFEHVPVERLIGADIQPESLNEHVLGRCLDTLFDHDLESLYCQISMTALQQLGGIQACASHLDSTSFHVHGDTYDTSSKAGAIRITHGLSKDHRPDLKQAMLQLICDNKSGIPLLMAPADGNSQDKKGFRELIDKHIDQLRASKMTYLIADSALYSAESLQRFDTHGVGWITRVPETSKDTHWALTHADVDAMQPLAEGYRYVALSTTYADVRQRWLMIHSESKQARAAKTLAKSLEKATRAELKLFERLKKKVFMCPSDAQCAYRELADKLKYGHIEDMEIQEKKVYAKRGRPSETSEIDHLDYMVCGHMSVDISTYQTQVARSGYFILATNECDATALSDVACFELYKDQNTKVERGFRFMKDPMFMLDNLFLKTPHRIMALMMVMTLCLLVYAALEFTIRRELKEKQLSFPNQKGRMVQHPTARWVFFYFKNITVLMLYEGSSKVLNLDRNHLTIIDLLGPQYDYYYS